MPNLIPFIALGGLLLATNLPAQQTFVQGKNELTLSEGAFSVDELLGMTSQNNGPASYFMSFPGTISGALFLSCHRTLARGFALGVSCGLDNQHGNLSYGRIDHGYFGLDGVTGWYDRKAFTVAIEGRVTYYRRGKMEAYGCYGVAWTATQLDYHFNAGIQDPEFFYGTGTSLVPTNPYTTHSGYFSGQASYLGYRYGNQAAAFIEFGAGYKGLVSGGVSVKF